MICSMQTYHSFEDGLTQTVKALHLGKGMLREYLRFANLFLIVLLHKCFYMLLDIGQTRPYKRRGASLVAAHTKADCVGGVR